MTHTIKQSQTKNIYMVLGFARSGTSVITRGINALGINLGDKIIKHSAENTWNPTGFFEDEEIIYKINAKVYETLGQRIRSIPIINHDAFHYYDLSTLRKDAARILQERFLHTDHWGFKNPSSSKIIPFWQSVFTAEKLKEHYIIALRNPLSSASSFAKLTNVDLETALLLWLTHIIPAIDETLDRRSIVVSYERMLQNPIVELNRMKDQLNIHSLNEDISSYTDQFINPKLYHHRFNTNDLTNHPALAFIPICRDIYHLLLDVASDTLTLQSPAFASSWQLIKKQFEQNYPIYCYIDSLLKRNKENQLQIRHIKKSILWKLFYPIRYADDLLRTYRAKKRTKKRLLTAYE